MDWVAEDLILLALRPNGKFQFPRSLPFAVTGAELTAIMALGRVEIQKKRIVVTDARPIGDPLLDAALASMRSDKRPLVAKKWMGRRRRDGVIDSYLAQLEVAGVIEQRRRKRWYVAAPERYQQARGHLHMIATGTANIDLPLAALAGLADAIRMARFYYRGNELKRIKAAGRSHPGVEFPVKVVQTIIAEMNAASSPTPNPVVFFPG